MKGSFQGDRGMPRREADGLRVWVTGQDQARLSRVVELLDVARPRGLETHVVEPSVATDQSEPEEAADAVVLAANSWQEADLNTLNALRARLPHLPIIVVASREGGSLAQRLAREGAQDCLWEEDLDGRALEQSILCAVERKRRELALVREERKYHGIFDNLVEGVFQTTPDGHYISANAALARIYGYDTPEELVAEVTDIGRKLYVQPGRRSEFVRLMEQHDVVSGFESQICRKDESRIWISENCRAIRDARGELVCYEGTVEDITARKDAEERLLESEALYHSLVETLPQNIFRKDREGRFTFVNHRFCLTVGRTAEEIIGHTDVELFPPDLAAKYQRDDRAVMESGQVLEAVEEHHAAQTGERMFVQLIKTPLYDGQGVVIGLQGLFWDITEKRRAEEKIQRANQELARSREELRLRNEQMMEDLAMARETQQAILPQQYPSFPCGAAPEKSRLRFCHLYEPTGEVGGDFFNVYALSDTRASVFLCDVMGHGVRSALVTAMMRALIEELKPLADDPGRFLTRLNRDFRALLRSTGSPMFTTAFSMTVDLEAEEMIFANAAHPKPLLLRRNQGSVQSVGGTRESPGPALGLFGESIYETYRSPLQPGDLVLLFTDGLYDVEGLDDVLYNRDMLVAAVRKHAALSTPELFNALMMEIRNFAATQQFEDDVCMLGVDVAAP